MDAFSNYLHTYIQEFAFFRQKKGAKSARTKNIPLTARVSKRDVGALA